MRARSQGRVPAGAACRAPCSPRHHFSSMCAAAARPLCLLFPYASHLHLCSHARALSHTHSCKSGMQSWWHKRRARNRGLGRGRLEAGWPRRRQWMMEIRCAALTPCQSALIERAQIHLPQRGALVCHGRCNRLHLLHTLWCEGRRCQKATSVNLYTVLLGTLCCSDAPSSTLGCAPSLQTYAH